MEGSLQSSESTIEFDPERLPGLIAGEWYERSDEDRLAGKDFALRHRATLPANFENEANASPSDYVTMTAAWGDGTREGKIKYVVRATKVAVGVEEKPLPPDAIPAELIPQDKMSGALRAALAKATPDELIPILISLKEELPTDLAPPLYNRYAATFSDSESREEHRALVQQRIQLREQEAMRSQAPLVQRLRQSEVEVEPEGSIWIANAVIAKASRSQIEALESDSDVRRIELNVTGEPAASWSGFELGSSLKMNAGRYYSAGQDGNSASGRLKIAIIDRNFNYNHPVFKDNSGSSLRVIETWNCENNPCTSPLPVALGGDAHGTWVSSVAAGDSTDGQIAGSSTFREQRSGVAREANVILLFANNAVVRALQRAVQSGADVVNESLGGTPDCSGAYSAWNEAVYQAELAGTLVTLAAGNEGDSSTCNLAPMGSAPSGLAVGNVFNDVASNYAVADLEGGTNGSSTGPVGAYIDGSYFPTAFTQVGVSVSGRFEFCAMVSSSSFQFCSGTSIAAPIVAGAGILLRHSAIDLGWGSTADIAGWLRANLLTMADRADSASTKLSSRFHRRWGAGRFQMRHISGADHPTWPWMWQTARFVMTSGQAAIEFPVFDTGAEPVGLQQIKVVALTIERDGSNAADIDVFLRKGNCSGTTMVSDQSLDYKSMVRTGAAGGGEQLCVRLLPFYIPIPQNRLIQLVIYYSGDTAMR